jgi:hypothetical protein
VPTKTTATLPLPVALSEAVGLALELLLLELVLLEVALEPPAVLVASNTDSEYMNSLASRHTSRNAMNVVSLRLTRSKRWGPRTSFGAVKVDIDDDRVPTVLSMHYYSRVQNEAK